MLILQVDGKMVITTLRNQYYHAYVLLLCIMDEQNNLGSKTQAEIALSTTEREYIDLSTSMQELIPFMSIMKKTTGLFGILTRDPVFCCTVWEDNESCITVLKRQKFTPRKEHIAIKYHHFQHFVSDGKIIMNSIDTTEQIAHIFTNPLGEKSFYYLHHQLMGR